MSKRQPKKITEVRVETIKNGYVVSYWSKDHDQTQKFFSDLDDALSYVEEIIDTDIEEDDDDWML